MTAIAAILPYVQILLAVLMTVAILLQRSDAISGGIFGGTESVSTWHTRRGADKVLFISTVVIAALFIASSLVALVIHA